jgi:hypothetical protein
VTVLHLEHAPTNFTSMKPTKRLRASTCPVGALVKPISPNVPIGVRGLPAHRPRAASQRQLALPSKPVVDVRHEEPELSTNVNRTRFLPGQTSVLECPEQARGRRNSAPTPAALREIATNPSLTRGPRTISEPGPRQ